MPDAISTHPAMPTTRSTVATATVGRDRKSTERNPRQERNGTD
jgi:hypothetical protein